MERDGAGLVKRGARVSEVVRAGSEVEIHYRLRLADGTLVDSSRGEAPLRFVVGDGTLDPGLERLLHGLRSGERRELAVAPGTAFGCPDPAAVQSMSRGDFPDDMTLNEGSIIAFDTPAGEELLGTVLEVSEAQVRLDFNHPLAGRRLSFEVEIVSVKGENG